MNFVEMTSARRSDSVELQPYVFEEDPDSECELGFGEEDGNGVNNIPYHDNLEQDAEYDAVNDETFGDCEPISNVEGLEDVSERTKLLDLGDNEITWPDPDPHSIPMPSVMKTDKTDSNNQPFADWLVNADLQPSSSNILSSSSNDDFFSFMNDPSFSACKKFMTEEDILKEISHPSVSKQFNSALLNDVQFFAQSGFQDVGPKVFTEEDILRMHSSEKASNVFEAFRPTTKPGTPTVYNGQSCTGPLHKPRDSSSGINNFNAAPSYFNLPSSNNMMPPFPSNLPGFGNLPAQNIQPPSLSSQHFVPDGVSHPPSPFKGANSLMQFLNSISNANSMPPQNAGSMRSTPLPQPPPHAGMPPMMPPPFPMFCPFSPAMSMMNQHPHQQSYSRRDSISSSNTGRFPRRTCLPSNKTISDFAFDPYAGLMSKKEREWLIKIQIIQCMGTGEAVDDDYYYSVWKDQNVLAKAPAAWKVQLQPKYYSFDDTYPSDRYVPPVFNGSLGRPTHASTSYPRQIIDLHSDSVDDEESTTGRVNSQKKLRAVLLRIENVALALLECRDILYKSAKQDGLDTTQQIVVPAVQDKIRILVSSVARMDQLPTIMLIQKGRSLMAQLISQADDVQKCVILNALVSALPSFARKIPTDSNNQSLTRSIINALRSVDLIIFKSFRENLSMESFEQIIIISPFAQQICLAFLIGLCGREISESEIVSDPVGTWLCDTNNPERLHSLFNVLNQEAIDLDLLQLYRGLSYFPASSIGAQMASVLKARIKQRPS